MSIRVRIGSRSRFDVQVQACFLQYDQNNCHLYSLSGTVDTTQHITPLFLPTLHCSHTHNATPGPVWLNVMQHLTRSTSKRTEPWPKESEEVEVLVIV